MSDEYQSGSRKEPRNPNDYTPEYEAGLRDRENADWRKVGDAFNAKPPPQSSNGAGWTPSAIFGGFIFVAFTWGLVTVVVWLLRLIGVMPPG